MPTPKPNPKIVDKCYLNFIEDMKAREKALKQAGIGGKWELIDPQGNKVSSDNFKGKWCMIYFGFTHCPGLIPM